MNEYYVHLLILIGMYLVLTQSYNLTFGLGWLFNLAHVSAYGIGAYVTALLTTAGWGTLSAVGVSMAAGGIFAGVLGWISLRLSQECFAIGSLACAAVVSALMVNWRTLTNGVLGITAIPRPEIFGVSFVDNRTFLLLTALYVVLWFAALLPLFYGPYGRALRALAQLEHGAVALGVNAVWLRNSSFFVASAGAALAGSLYAEYINYVDPSSFTLTEMIFVLSVVIVGRPGSFLGCIGATTFLLLLPEALRRLDLSAAVLGPLRQLLYASILFGVVYVMRHKLFPQQRQV